MFKDLSLESKNMQTQNCAPIHEKNCAPIYRNEKKKLIFRNKAEFKKILCNNNSTIVLRDLSVTLLRNSNA